tara:strand:- start:8546 stop:9877 length:1332 start_codon:yes stop_codon:yes gene_type:complete
MSILAFGLNYRTAPVELRERIAFTDDALGSVLDALLKQVPSVSEVAVVSTCNRTEFYCVTSADTDAALSDWLAVHYPIERAELEGASYCYWDQEAARHMIRVASGLDSQVLGEPQIMDQVKTAFGVARAAGTLGSELDLLSRIVLQTAKAVRSETQIGRNPVSVAYAAVSLAKKIFSDLNSKKALLLGAGETISLVADHLTGQRIGQIAIANRTLTNAQNVAERFNADAMQLIDVADRLAEFDVVIASTGSNLPVLGKGTVENAIKQRRRKPIFMVDIAVPRDIEEGVGDLPDVYLYSIDDLTQIVEANREQRASEAKLAERFVVHGANQFWLEKQRKRGQALLKAFRAQADGIREQELTKALRQLDQGKDATEVLAQLSNNLSNKLIHAPTVALREASAENQNDMLAVLKRIYALEDFEVNEPAITDSNEAAQSATSERSSS